MSEGDLLARCPFFELPPHIDNMIANLQGKGLGGNAVRDSRAQLSPPEGATWTGKQYQLALCWSGQETWMELRQYINGVRVVVGESVYNRADFTSTVAKFLQLDGGT